MDDLIREEANNQTQQAKKQTNHIAEVSKMDLISRQAAIDAVSGCGICIQKVLDIPPAQPEDCSTCKHGHFGDRQCDYCGVRYPSHYERNEK